MRPGNLFVAAATIAAFLVAAAPAVAGLTRPEQALVAAINVTRARHHLPELQLDPALERAARSHTRDMLLRGYFDHGSFLARMERFGVRGRAVGENLAWWPGSRALAHAVVRIWLRDPAHRANLLRPGFRRVGVAAVRGRYGGGKVRMVTADFAGR